MPTEETERDTHFQSFARLLQREISKREMQHLRTRTQSGIIYSGRELAEEIQLVIAQHAYDFAYHILREMFLERDIAEQIHQTPDMLDWPEES